MKTFFLHRLPRLWNSIPIIDLSLSLSTIKSKLKKYFWNQFVEHFNSDDHCTVHYLCPCSKCYPSSTTSELHNFVIPIAITTDKYSYNLNQGRNQTQQVGRARHGPTYNGPIYLYRLSILSGSLAGHSKHLVGPMPCCIDMPLILINVSVINY